MIPGHESATRETAKLIICAQRVAPTRPLHAALFTEVAQKLMDSGKVDPRAVAAMLQQLGQGSNN